MQHLNDELREALAGRFAIQREIARGGMGTVLLAHDGRLDRDVAIKVLSPELSAQLGADRFEREIRMTARLVHPNIVPLFDSGEAAGQLYFVMPFIDSGTLRDRLESEGRRPAAEVMRVLADLGEALAYAHAIGIIHRDVKPENVFWYGGRALLADFGIATASSATMDGRRLTGTGLVLGTLAYMSPEQASGERKLDGRSDIYALGCMAYELLAGEPPFAGDTPMALVAAHLTAAVPAVSTVRSDIEPAFSALLERMMAKQTDDRPTNAAAFLAELRRSAAAPATVDPAPESAAPRRAAAAIMAPEAREPYDRAVVVMNTAMQGGPGTRDKLEMARVYFEKALAAAPNDAHVLAKLADLTHILAIRGFNDWDDSFRRSKEYRLRALAADDTIGEVHISLGALFLYWEDDFETAGTELALGAKLAPDSADGRRMYGAWLKIAGRRDEALREMREAVRLAPNAPFMRVGLADVLMTLGRYDEAVGPLREALRLSARYEAALERMEMACHRAGRHDEALDARRIMHGMRGDTERMNVLEADVARDGWLLAREQDLRRELGVLLAQAEREDPFTDVRGSRQLSDRIIITLAELGEWRQAMDWVERGYYRRPGRLRRVVTDLPYDHHGLAIDPRYARLLRTAGLSELL
ncbi:MAG TPA: serine/threonine-protein kinase [Gemmatimonadales bacterium]|jgi:tetratricopeptide (TPR) repeat protein